MPVSRSLLKITNPLAEIAPIKPENGAHIRELAVLQDGGFQPPRVLAFSPDCKTLACSTLDSLIVWDVEKQRKQFERKIAALSMAFSPDGATLVVSGREISFLDARNGETKATLKGHRDGTTGIAFSPDGRLLATGGMDGMVRVGDLATKKLVRTLEHQAQVRGVAFSPDGETMATVAWGDPQAPRGIYLWNFRTGDKINMIKCQTEKNLSFSPDGRVLAVDGTLYHADSLQVLHDFKERYVAFSPDSKLVASCRSDFTTVGLWDIATGNKLAVLKGHTEGIWCVAFSPDGKLLASGSGKIDMKALLQADESVANGDKSVRLWGIPKNDPDETKPLQTTTKILKRLYPQ
jgi:WD40 repeat protein